MTEEATTDGAGEPPTDDVHVADGAAEPSTDDAHAADPHGAGGHGGGGADAHAGHDSTLGPVDWRAYGAGVVGAVLGLAVAALLAVSAGYVVL